LGFSATLLVAVAGCGLGGTSTPREPVSGTVTFDGHPLEAGTIQFQPAGRAEGVASWATITAGRFDIPRAEGPVPGKYMVAIFNAPGDRPAGGSADATVPVPRSRNRSARTDAIPARYNARSELTAEVKAGGPNSFTFDLKK
jgi:hypothetical protein